MYSTDLAHIHDTGFDDYAQRVAPEIVRILRRHGIRRGTVVEVGCGSGTVARHLTRCGYDVIGYDISAAMIRLARAKAPRARFRVGSLTTIRIPRCAAVVSVGEVVTYVPGGRRALERFFARVHRALEPRGLLIFDFIASARRRTYASRTRRGDGWSVTVRAPYDPSTGVITRRLVMTRRVGARVRRTRETHRIHVYTRREMLASVAGAGFDARASDAFGRCGLIVSDLGIVARRKPRV
jgi:SAM-dependent methyltransferase